MTLNPATPVAALREAARDADLLLCMSVNPGWGGQSFIEASIDRLARAAALLRPGMGLEVDGGVAPGDDRALPRGRARTSWSPARRSTTQPSPGEAWKALAALAGA